MIHLRPANDEIPHKQTGSPGLSSVQKKIQNLLSQKPLDDVTSSSDSRVEKTRLGLTLLHSPNEPLVDFIFVHGLRGGSIKTWSKNGDPSKFWPKKWIALDTDLHHVRTSSFGYPSDWGSRQDSILNIDDFGRNLFGEISSSPYLRKDRPNPIVLIGHSMGGLVMKKAYLLARQKSPEIADRIKCMVFLATPHRGSDSAELVKKLLKIVGSEQPYVEELLTKSRTLQLINEDFTKVADTVNLWSFFETIKTTIGVKSELIVHRDSAVLGYPNENIRYINANHRGICKFDTPQDENYITIRNALVAIADDLLQGTVQVTDEQKLTAMQSVGTFLNILEAPVSDLEELQDLKTPDSCNWILERMQFQHWLQDDTENEEHREIPPITKPGRPCNIYWLTGKPGAGKSVCAAHVISDLQAKGYDTSYFFFKFGIGSKHTVSTMLRSLAYQMANQHSSIRTALQNMQQVGQSFDNDDERVIWRIIFVACILKARLHRPQYWVIDALDECFAIEKLFPLLMRLDSAFNLRIFVTSRPKPELKRAFGRLTGSITVSADSIQSSDTRRDMGLYLESFDSGFEAQGGTDNADVISKLLTRANDCFLWLHLVRLELEEVCLENSVAEVLEGIPVEMSELYARSLESLPKENREINLAQALFTWVACAHRPLTLSELQIALKYDGGLQIRKDISQPDLQRFIEGLCGNLLYVDQAQNVQPIHATVLDFLHKQGLESEYAVDRELGHERLAMACLKCLEAEMRPPRGRSDSSLKSRKQDRSSFIDYASLAFGEHIAASSSTSDELLIILSRFLNTSVLAWIAHVASEQPSLYILTRTAKNFQKYLEKRAQRESPPGKESKLVLDWSTDLIRLVTKFGKNLKSFPQSIFFIIPSIAPKQSRLYQRSLDSPRWVDLIAPAATEWDDCVSTIQYTETRACTIGSGQSSFALGMRKGKITLYDQSTCLEILSVQHQGSYGGLKTSQPAQDPPYPVKLIVFDSADEKFASVSMRSICVWSIDGTLLKTFFTPEPCVTLTFSIDQIELIGVTRSSRIVRWKLVETETEENARLLKTASANARTFSSGNIDQRNSQLPGQTPIVAAISPDQSMLALLYRGRPIYLCSLEDNTILGLCGREVNSQYTNAPVLCGLFNPNPESRLLAVSHEDGELALYDAWTQRELVSVDGDAYTLASTPNGRTLATGNNRGTIRLWDFESLTPLYSIRYGLDHLRSLAFTGDGFRLVDIRDNKTKVWEPSVLVRRLTEDDAKVSDRTTLEVPIVDEKSLEASILVMRPDENDDFIFAALDDGSVVVYESRTGQLYSVLHQHPSGIFVTSMAYRANLLATSHAGGRVLLWKISRSNEGISCERLLDRPGSGAVQQLLISPNGQHLLIENTDTNTLWNLEKQEQVAELAHSSADLSSSQRWATIGQDIVAMVSDKTLSLFHWDSLQEFRSISLEVSASLNMFHTRYAQDLTTYNSGKLTVTCLSLSNTGRSKTHLAIWINLFKDSGIAETLENTTPTLEIPSNIIRTFLGIYAERIVFLDHELWICSISLKDARTAGLNNIRRHFFIYTDFLNDTYGSEPILTSGGRVVFAQGKELAIFKGDFNWSVA